MAEILETASRVSKGLQLKNKGLSGQRRVVRVQARIPINLGSRLKQLWQPVPVTDRGVTRSQSPFARRGTPCHRSGEGVDWQGYILLITQSRLCL